jgi:hypothetical protein
MVLPGDALANIARKHSHFLRLTKLHPNVEIVLASNFGLDTLKSSATTIVDGTFSTTECDLVLTTLLAESHGIIIPCAYLLSNSKTTKTYKTFYEVNFFFLLFRFIKFSHIFKRQSEAKQTI